jgi:hypothetical protein
VVNDTICIVIVPDAGAVALIEMVGVVSDNVAASAGLPAGIGPGEPYCILFAAAGDPAGLVTVSGVVSGLGCACQNVGLDAGGWLVFDAWIDL